MKYWICFIVVVLIFACKPKNQQPDAVGNKTALTDTTIVTPEEISNEFQKIDSIGEIKNLIFRAFQQHQSDSAYRRFAFFYDKEESLYQSEIQIGNLFHPNLKSAVLGWSVTDSTIDVEVFHFQHESWKSVFKTENIPSRKMPSWDKFFFFFDYNHDGWKDLEVVAEAWDIGTGYCSHFWLVNPGSFTPVEGFEKIIAPEPDSVGNLIYSYYPTRCADMGMQFAVWKLKNKKVRLIKTIYMDCCEDVGPKCEVSIDDGKPFFVAHDKVHLYVPKHFREWLKSKMAD